MDDNVDAAVNVHDEADGSQYLLGAPTLRAPAAMATEGPLKRRTFQSEQYPDSSRADQAPFDQA